MNYELRIKTAEGANNADISNSTLHNSNRGFGLVEVVVAAGVLSIVGVLGVLFLFRKSVVSDASGEPSRLFSRGGA